MASEEHGCSSGKGRTAPAPAAGAGSGPRASSGAVAGGELTSGELDALLASAGVLSGTGGSSELTTAQMAGVLGLEQGSDVLWGINWADVPADVCAPVASSAGAAATASGRRVEFTVSEWKEQVAELARLAPLSTRLVRAPQQSQPQPEPQPEPEPEPPSQPEPEPQEPQEPQEPRQPLTGLRAELEALRKRKRLAGRIGRTIKRTKHR